MRETSPSTDAAAKRLFFALWPDEALRRRLHALGGELLGNGRGRRLPAENLHLTLAFLGFIDPKRQACLEREVSEIQSPAFSLILDRAGFWARKGILWVGGTPSAGLLALVGTLNQKLSVCGFEPELRPYQIHLTLARNVRQLRLERDHAIGPLAWSVNQFALVASETLPGGARYEVLRTWDLGT